MALPEDLLVGAVRPPLGQTLPLLSGSTEAAGVGKVARWQCLLRQKEAPRPPRPRHHADESHKEDSGRDTGVADRVR